MISAATVLFYALVTSAEPAESSWSAPPDSPQQAEAAPVPDRKPPAAGSASALSGTRIRDVALALGAWAARPYGIGVLGGLLHVSVASEMDAGAPKWKFVEAACDLRGGQTIPGLPVGEGVVTLTAWSNPRKAVRGGVGLDAGLVGYRRATTGGWEVGSSAGGHLALHADVLRPRDRAGFVEVSAGIRALSSRGVEFSAVALVGLAFRSEEIFVRRAERSGRDEPADPD